ncbi:MAG TPA: M23 family peptidase [Treponema sp.]|nr:M23 family peptidase [Treponema sp.]
MKKRHIICIVAALLSLAAAYGKELSFERKDYNIRIFYNDTAFPGDAVFVRLYFVQSARQHRKAPEGFAAAKAQLELYLDAKRLDKAAFYALPAESGRNGNSYMNAFLCGIPLSSWWQEKNNYHLSVACTLPDGTTETLELPFALTHKDFVSETIPLDDRNTSIKTDTSSKRTDQINRLNAILGTVTESSVFQTAAYTPPTPATRRTSFFADRRVYTYTNGKSSTSLHYGIDYGVPTGSRVTACAAGTVVMAEDRISTGWSVVIEHLPGLYSLYYHMSELKVKTGDTVQPGDLVGLSGATGLATGPHLHWEMRLNMSAVSPDFFTTDFTSEEEARKALSQ